VFPSARLHVSPKVRVDARFERLAISRGRLVHGGYFSKKLPPVIEVVSGDFVTMEAITHHAYDDH